MKKLELKIPQPCGIPPEEMEKLEKGYFCKQCNQEVIDFTHYTDRQLIEFFSSSKGSVCGSIKENQLNKIIHIPEKFPSFQSSFMQKILLSTTLMLGFSGKSIAGTSPLSETIVSHEKKSTSKNLLSGGCISISGIIKDEESGHAIPGVTIRLKGTTLGASTDIKGNFLLELPSFFEGKELILEVSCLGCAVKEVTLQPDKLENLEIRIDQKYVEVFGLGAETVKSYVGGAISVSKKNCFYWFKNLFRRKNH